MVQSKLKSNLEIQRMNNEIDYISVNHAVNKHQNNFELVKNGTESAEKTLTLIVLTNVLLALSLLILNYISSQTFTKDVMLNILSQFNILLPLLMSAPIIFMIFKNFLSDNNEEKKLNFSVIGKIVGTFTILTLVPFISIVMTYILKTQLI